MPRRAVYLKKTDNTCPFCGTTFKDGGCPNCGAIVKDISRITGYLSFDERFCASKTAERSQRVDHNGTHENNYIQ